MPNELLGPLFDNLGFTRGLRAAMVLSKRYLLPLYAALRKRLVFYFLNVLLKAKIETMILNFNNFNFGFSKAELSDHQFFCHKQ